MLPGLQLFPEDWWLTSSHDALWSVWVPAGYNLRADQSYKKSHILPSYTRCTQCVHSVLPCSSQETFWWRDRHPSCERLEDTLRALPGEVTEVFFVFRPRCCRSSRIAYTKNKAGRSECESGMAAWPWHGKQDITGLRRPKRQTHCWAAAGRQAAVLEAAEKRGLQSTGGSPIGPDTKAFGPFGYIDLYNTIECYRYYV